MEGTPYIESSSDNSDDKKEANLSKAEKKSKSKAGFKAMPHSVLEQLMNRTTEEKVEKPKKEEVSREEKSKDTGNELEVVEDMASLQEVVPGQLAEFSENASVKEILESVEDEIVSPEEPSDEALNIDMSEFEAEFAEDENSVDENAESLGQIIQRNFSVTKGVGNGNVSNSSNPNNVPVIPVSGPDLPLVIPNNPNNIPPVSPSSNGPNTPNLPPPPANNPNVPPPVGPNQNQPPNTNNPNIINPSATPNVINHNTVINPVEYHNSAPTAALLAIDYLSHRANKKRTEKVAKKLEGQIDELKESQKLNEFKIADRFSSSENQQTEMNNQLQELDKRKEQAIHIAKHDEIYNILPNTVLKNEISSEQVLNQIVENQTVRNNETFVQQAAEAKGHINSEFAFERRHEVKDVPSQSRVSGSQDGVIPGMDEQPVAYKKEQEIHRIVNQPVEKYTLRDSSNTKEVVTTGIWGALVGIAIFIVIYVLTNR